MHFCQTKWKRHDLNSCLRVCSVGLRHIIPGSLWWVTVSLNVTKHGRSDSNVYSRRHQSKAVLMKMLTTNIASFIEA